ncbi:MAG: DNA topoisomerase I, partial [Gammaproteobacteria bacterium]|nr:DNA topoisomerase I [Gammaproteobacteria bacterium]
MAKQLVIVESPAKAKTINKYLGSDYQVLASYGHVRDLLPKNGAVDPEHHFAMRYDLIAKNKAHVEAIAKALKNAETLILATDPDREGEAISWHLAEIMQERGLLKDKNVQRVVFYEITQKAVKAAMAEPRQLSMELINAQQARRAL